MPYGRYSRTNRRPARKVGRTYKKRTTVARRARVGRKRYSKISRRGPMWKNPVPTQGMYKFVYHDTGFAFATNVGNGYLSVKQFRGNSVFDPDYTGVGVQPYGLDNLLGANCPFGRYIVYGSKITVFPHLYTAAQAGANATGSWAVKLVLYPFRTNGVTYSGFDDLCRIPYHQARCIENQDDAGGNNILKRYASTKMIMPEAGKLEDMDFGAVYNQNPVQQWYWTIVMDSTTYNNDVTGYFDVKITYYTKLLKLDTVNES